MTKVFSSVDNLLEPPAASEEDARFLRKVKTKNQGYKNSKKPTALTLIWRSGFMLGSFLVPEDVALLGEGQPGLPVGARQRHHVQGREKGEEAPEGKAREQRRVQQSRGGGSEQ